MEERGHEGGTSVSRRWFSFSGTCQWVTPPTQDQNIEPGQVWYLSHQHTGLFPPVTLLDISHLFFLGTTIVLTAIIPKPQ